MADYIARFFNIFLKLSNTKNGDFYGYNLCNLIKPVFTPHTVYTD